MGANILKQIFFDHNHHWDNFIEKYGSRIRPNVLKEVEKFRLCGDPKNGFKLLVCDVCHDVKIVPYRCKGRFCTTCFSGETEEWSRFISEDIFQTKHRHVVFTIDEGLRVIFQKHRNLLKGLMDESVRLVQDYFKQKLKVTPGVIAGLHTFGAQLNFNPHVHMLVTMGGMKQNGEWKVYDYIPFEMLRKQWQTVVLKLIRGSLSGAEKKRVQPLLQKAYAANGDGFYVHAPKQNGNVREQLAYIGRYIRRPAIALHRIEAYDSYYVTYRYKDKNDGQEKRETLPVEEFIARLISHIPDEQFKVIRHYGVYSRRIKALSRKLVTKWQKEARKMIARVKRKLKRRTWGQRLKDQTGKDPMECPRCGDQYVYKGEVCPNEGKLEIVRALGDKARACLERMIFNITGIEATQTQEKKERDQQRQVQGTSAKYSQLHLLGV